MSCVYIATNKLTGEFYVGSTRQKIQQRKSTHLSEARKDSKDGKIITRFHKDLILLGLDGFVWNEISGFNDYSEMEELELFISEELGSFEPFGYNSRIGRCKKVLCKETGEIFYCEDEAAKRFNCHYQTISRHCDSRESLLNLSDGKLYHLEYV